MDVSAPTICMTLKIMGCSHQRIQHIALQRCEDTRARFMAEISIIMLQCLFGLTKLGATGETV